jgi:hypothetical protein
MMELTMMITGKTIAIRSTQVTLILASLLVPSSKLNAQQIAPPSDPPVPWACSFLPTGEENAEKNDPEEEQDYSRSFNAFYRLWCTSSSSSPRAKEDAANAIAERWKQLWYRDSPYDAAFHEIGSYELLLVIAVTHELPKPLVADPTFMQDWLKDCRGSCFQIFGNDDPSAKAEAERLHRLRNEVMIELQGNPAAKPVVEMLKNARLDDLVN